jgi:hypothetical protein
VPGAGTSFINGIFEFDAKRIGPNGYVKSGIELQYHRRIPPDGDTNPGGGSGGVDVIVDDDSDVVGSSAVSGIVPQPQPQEQTPMAVVGRTITLFWCTMRSSQKWWFLSEADEDQPGTDKDVDYYQHKSKREEEAFPSSSGWLTCRAGADPPPTLEAIGKLVPLGEEYNTLEHQLAKWAIDNGVIELVLGDGIHREVVSRSAGLIKFLAGMSGEDDVDNPEHAHAAEEDGSGDDDAPDDGINLPDEDMLSDADGDADADGGFVRAPRRDDDDDDDEDTDDDDDSYAHHEEEDHSLRVERNDPDLFKLKIGFQYHPAQGWEVLGASIGRNTHLKELEIVYEPLSQLGPRFFRGLAKNRSIKKLSFY